MRQIYDKFSEKKGGLKELYEKGPHNAFFLVKFWVSTLNQQLFAEPFTTYWLVVTLQSIVIWETVGETERNTSYSESHAHRRGKQLAQRYRNVFL